jgi:hypothetical protein
MNYNTITLILYYFIDSTLRSHDLHSVAIESFPAVFLLSNKFTLVPKSEDRKLFYNLLNFKYGMDKKFT